jgi:hypothetical protein
MTYRAEFEGAALSANSDHLHWFLSNSGIYERHSEAPDRTSADQIVEPALAKSMSSGPPAPGNQHYPVPSTAPGLQVRVRHRP